MNIVLFKKEIEKIDEHEVLLKKFRVWAENSYISYTKLLRCQESEIQRMHIEQDYYLSEEMKQFRYEWEYLSIYNVISLYSEMGWEVDDSIKNKELELDNDSDFLYYDTNIYYVYDKISTIEDDASFCYAICLLTEIISTKTKLYEKLVKKLYEGLDKYGLTLARKIIDNKKEETAFIAMSFSPQMRSVRKSIEDAINECGYKPVLIDIKEHNNQIVPEIFMEINNSKFIVADLTGQRGGVYYEAGYAQALNKSVILMCKKDEFKKVHFDVAQINTIFWEDEHMLYERLINRITATIGRK